MSGSYIATVGFLVLAVLCSLISLTDKSTGKSMSKWMRAAVIALFGAWLVLTVQILIEGAWVAIPISVTMITAMLIYSFRDEDEKTDLCMWAFYTWAVSPIPLSAWLAWALVAR